MVRTSYDFLRALKLKEEVRKLNLKIDLLFKENNILKQMLRSLGVRDEEILKIGISLEEDVKIKNELSLQNDKKDLNSSILLNKYKKEDGE